MADHKPFDGRLADADLHRATNDAMRRVMGQPVPKRESIRDLEPVELVVGAGAGREVEAALTTLTGSDR